MLRPPHRPSGALHRCIFCQAIESTIGDERICAAANHARPDLPEGPPDARLGFSPLAHGDI